MQGALSWKTILVPHDFSDGADHAATIALAEARTHGASVLLLHIVELMPHFGPETRLILPEGAQTPIGIHHYARSRAEADLRQVAARLAGDIAIETFVREGNPIEEIADFARQKSVDLIVMGTHGRTGLRRVVVGSVAERMVRTSQVPVLTTRHPG